MAFQGASSSSSFTRGWWTYDVFLSFRGKDTRNNFIAHLHDGLHGNLHAFGPRRRCDGNVKQIVERAVGRA
jgi:hypothetical protein